MRVRRIDSNGDWQFGRGLSDYARDDEAIGQNVITRLKSFKNDWFLDVDAEIDWFDLLGRKGTQEEIEREIERVTLATDGVLQLNSLKLTKQIRNVTISMNITTIFNTELSLNLGLES